MATFPVSEQHDYSGESLGGNPIDQILFTNTAGATATFGSNQFGAGAGFITNDVLLTGNAQVNIIAVRLSATGTFSAAAFQFSAGWNAPLDTVILFGTADNDILTGSSQHDLIAGGDGADNLNGGAGDDTFSVTGAGLAAGEAIDGGADNDTLRLNPGAHDLTLAGTSITSVETLLFLGTNISLIASGTHFGGAGDFTSVIGSAANTQSLTVNGQTVNLLGITFIDWDGANQTITINGTNAGANALFGSNKKDTINGTGNSIDAMRGGDGADTLNGGGGTDSFNYAAAGEVDAGENIFGGGGTDAITLTSAGANDFSLATITDVETLDFESGNSTATFSGTQIGVGAAFTLVSGSAATDGLVVNAAPNVDLTGLAFNTWTDGTDTITINGTTAGETLTGSSKNDIIIGGGGADIINGGNGSDTFRYSATGEFASGETVNGGTGTNTLEIAGGTHDFSSGTLSFIAALTFTGAATAAFRSDQIGGGNIQAITGSAGADAIVASSFFSVNLASLTFTNWTDGTDTITINGTGVVSETLTGSSKNDIIIGGRDADTMSGGDGDDVFRYIASFDVSGAESVDGGNGTDTLEIAGGNHNFSTGATLTKVEALRFTGAATVTLKGTDVAGPNIVAVSGSAGADTLVVNGIFVASFFGDLSALTFTNWTAGVDTITLNGTAGGDSGIVGSSQNDTIRGFGGNDSINGGGGIDTAVFSGLRSAYTITRNGNTVTVSGPDGTDTLQKIEKLAFDDVTIPTQAPTDFNADSFSDLLWQNNNGQAHIWSMNGTTIVNQQNAGSNPGPSWHVKDKGDFNADGMADILWQNDSGQAAIWLMNGSTQIGGGTVGANPGPSWHVKCAADFNGDGMADILWQNDSGQAHIWIMNGTNIIGQQNAGGNPGASWHIKDAGDFSGDGKADILWQDDSGQAAIWLMNGSTQVGGGTVGTNPGATWHVMNAGDFNSDGKADILWQNDNGQAHIWFMNGSAIVSQQNAGANPGASWHVKDAADSNADGRADIVWQNDNGQAAIWLMNGSTQIGGGTVGTNPGTDWHII